MLDTAVCLLIIVTVSCVIGVTVWLKMRQWMSKNFKDNVIGDLGTQHVFFDKIQNAITYKLDRLDFGDTQKSYLLRFMLRTRLEVWFNEASVFYAKNYKSMSHIHETRLRGTQSIEDRCLEIWLSKMIPRRVVRIFNEWHLPRVQYARKNAEVMCRRHHNNRTTKEVVAILLTLDACILDLMLMDAEKDFRGMSLGKPFRYRGRRVE